MAAKNVNDPKVIAERKAAEAKRRAERSSSQGQKQRGATWQKNARERREGKKSGRSYTVVTPDKQKIIVGGGEYTPGGKGRNASTGDFNTTRQQTIPRVKNTAKSASTKKAVPQSTLDAIQGHIDSLKNGQTIEDVVRTNSLKRLSGEMRNNTTPKDDLTEKMQGYINAGKLTKEQKKEAKAVLKEAKAKREQEYKQGNFDSISGLGTDSYKRFQAEKELEAKTNGAGVRGALLPVLKAANAITKGIENVTNTQNTKAAKTLNEQLEAALRQDELSAEQSPIAHGIGNFAGNVAMYTATNPIFDAAATGLGVTSTAGKVIANQLGQNAQDIVLDTLPEYQRLKDMGLSDAEIRKRIGENVGWNVLGNAGAQVLSDVVIPAAKQVIPSLKNWIGNIQTNKISTPTQAIPELPTAIKYNGGNPVSNIDIGDTTANVAKINSLLDAVSGKTTKQDKAKINSLLDAISGKTTKQAQDAAEEINRIANIIPGTKAVNNGYDAPGADNISAHDIIDGIRNDINNYSTANLNATTKKNLDYLNGSLDRLETAYKSGENFEDAYEDYRKAMNRVRDNMTKKEGDDHWNNVYKATLGKDHPDNILSRFNKTSDWKVPVDADGYVDINNIDMDDLPFNDSVAIPANVAERMPDRSFTKTIKYEPETDINIKSEIPETPNEGNLKVSDTYENTLKNSGQMTEKEVAKRTKPEDFTYESKSEVQSMEEGARMRAEEGDEFVINRLQKEGFTQADTDGMMQAWVDKIAEARALEAAGEDASEAWEEANIIFRKIQTESSRNAQALQALAKWSRNTPEGMLSEAEHIVNKKIGKNSTDTGVPKAIKDKVSKNFDKNLVKRQEDVLLDYTKHLRNSIDLSGFSGTKKAVEGLDEALTNFDNAVKAGDIQSIKANHTAIKKKIKSMREKGLTLVMSMDEVDDAINNISKQSKTGGFEFTPEFQKNFIDEAAKIQDLDPDSREFKNAYARLGEMVGDEIRRNTSVPKRIVQMVTTTLMDNMLGNFRTLITRNAGGNLGLAAVEQVAERPLAAAIDSLVSLKTGKRTQAGLSKAGLIDYLTGFKSGLKDEGQDVLSGLHTSRTGEVNLADAILRNQHVFRTDSKNGLLKAASAVANFGDNVVSHGLSVGDRPFYEAVYKQTLGDLNRLRANGQLGDAVQQLSGTEFNTLADGVAKYNALVAVYQNDSSMSNALIGFKNSIGELSRGALGFDILSQFSMPFVKTPANVIDRAIDYSPLGAVRNAVRTGTELHANNFNQNRFANETARNILGTGLMAGAGAAAYNGLMSGKYSEDRDEKAAQKEAGMQEYALNLPNGYQMDISWAPVVGSNAVAADAAVQAFNNPDLSTLDKTLAGAQAGGKAMMDQSMFQGLQRLFGQGESYNSDDGIVANMINTVKQGATQAIPSLVRQIAQVTDPYQRDLSNGNYDINSIKNTIPGVRETMQPKVNSEGEYIQESQGRNIGMKIVEDMLLPGRITQVSPLALNTEAERLQALTGNNTAYEPKAKRSEITTDTHEPTDEEYTRYQVERNRAMSETGLALMNTEYYQSLKPEAQERMLNNLYTGIKGYVSGQYTGKESDDKIAEAYASGATDKEKVDNAVKALIYQNMFSEADLNSSEKLINYIESGGDLNDYKNFKASVQHTTESGGKGIYKDDFMTELSKLPKDEQDRIFNAISISLTDEEANAYKEGGVDSVLNVWQNNKKEAAEKAREKEAKEKEKARKHKEEARKAGVSEEKLDNLQEQLASLGANDSEKTVYYYNHAKQTIPSLTPRGYVNKLHEIGGDDYKITQKEMLSYGNNNNLSESDMNRYWKAFGDWKKIPVLVNGTWKAK